MSMEEIRANIARVKNKIMNELEKDMQTIVLDLQAEAQKKAPVDTGDLRGSASSKVTKSDDGVLGNVGFNTPYALKQHENLNLSHPRGGEAKYLENPMKERSGKYKDYVGETVRRVLNEPIS